MLFVAENVAKMKNEEFFEWLKFHMLVNDPNGEYEIKWIKSHLKEILSILFKWIEDSNGPNKCPFWLCIAVTKLNNIITKGGE